MTVRVADSESKIIRSEDARSTRIILAEDHDNTREALRVLLERKGFEVTAVASADEAATALIAADGPSIGVIDWMLPKGNGLDVCRLVRAAEVPHYVYLIIITGRDGEEDVALALAAGADDFIRKPCNASELVARVRTGQRIVELERTLAGRIEELQQALERVHHLNRLLPICMYCKKIRDDTDYWREIEEYIHTHSGTDFTHGICPTCMQNLLESAEMNSPAVKGSK